MSEYTLSKSPIDKNRLFKMMKAIFDESKADREQTQLAYIYFEGLANNGDNDPAVRLHARDRMTECLKLKQTSRDKAIKLIDMAVKLHGKTLLPKGELKVGERPGFNELSGMAENKGDQRS